MKWPAPLARAEFFERLNRFAATVRLKGRVVECHVPNPSHLRELLHPGVPVYLLPAATNGRRTQFNLVMVETDSGLASVDSHLPNRLFADAFHQGLFLDLHMHGSSVSDLGSQVSVLHSEVPFGSSRLDFALIPSSVGAELASARIGLRDVSRRKTTGLQLLHSSSVGRPPAGRHLPVTYIEVKSCTLARGGIAYFPDPASERASRHMNELARAVRMGHRAFAFFVIQRHDVHAFTPNDAVDPAFGRAFRAALAAGVEARAYRCNVSPTSVELDDPVEVLA